MITQEFEELMEQYLIESGGDYRLESFKKWFRKRLWNDIKIDSPKDQRGDKI